MHQAQCQDIQYTIFIAGDYARAVQICETFCLDGFCVTCEKTQYIYTFGKEQGGRIGLINYARFPRSAEELESKAFELAHKLLIGLNQGSFTVTGNGASTFISRRKND